LVIIQPDILKLITYSSSFSTLVPLVFFILFKRNSNEKTLRVIFYYILYCVINEIATYYFYEKHSETLFVVFALFSFAEFTFFCLFYHYLQLPGKIQKVVFVIWIIFSLFALVYFFFVNKTSSFDSILVTVESLLTILMCIYYLIILIKGSTNLSVYSTSNFWIIITFLIYVSGLFFLYIMTETMINDRGFQIQYTIINSAFNILKNILLSVAMLMKSTPVKNQPQKNYDWDNDLLSYKLKN
jgi:hypothetical protein